MQINKSSAFKEEDVMRKRFEGLAALSSFKMPDIFGNYANDTIVKMVAMINGALESEDMISIEDLREIFHVKKISKIKIDDFECVAKNAYETDLRSQEFAKLQRNNFIAEISTQFSNIVFGPGPQPPPKHDAHVRERIMLDAPLQYVSVFPNKPKILAEITHNKKQGGFEIHLLKQVLLPLPGMCKCTTRPTWKSFKIFPISEIKLLVLDQISSNSYTLTIQMQ